MDIDCDIFHTKEDRVNYLNSLKQKLEKTKKVKSKIENDLKLSVDSASKARLQKKLDKYNRIMVDVEFSIRLAQRDYNYKIKQNEEGTKLVRYMLNRYR